MDPDLADAEIDTLRFRLLHVPGRLVPSRSRHDPAHRCRLALGQRVHYLLEAPGGPAQPRLTSGGSVTATSKGAAQDPPGPWNPA